MGVRFPCDKEIPVFVKKNGGATFIEAGVLGLKAREFIDSCSVDNPKIVDCFVVPLPTRDMRRSVSVRANSIAGIGSTTRVIVKTRMEVNVPSRTICLQVTVIA